MPYYAPYSLTANTVHLTGAELITGLKTFQAGSAPAIALIVKGAAAQTGDLVQWQDSAGTVVARVTAVGSIGINSDPTSLTVPSMLSIQRRGSSLHDLMATYNESGVKVIRVAYDGSFSTTGAFSAGLVHAGSVFADTGPIYCYPSGGGVVSFGSSYYGASGHFVPGSVAHPALVAKGAVAQTADLQQWQTSAATVLVRVTSAGDISFAGGGQRSIYTDSGQEALRFPAGFVAQKAVFPAGAELFPSTVSNPGLTIRALVSQTADLFSATTNGGVVLCAITEAGLLQWSAAANQTAVAPVGASKWFKIKDSAGTVYLVEGKLP